MDALEPTTPAEREDADLERARPERAGVVTRFAAFFMDAVILTVSIHVVDWLLRAAARTLGRLAPPVNLNAILVAMVPFIVALYLFVFWSALGQTPGKWFMGIKIVPVEGGRLRPGRALLRLAGYVLSSLPVYLGFVWILGPRRRGWHDILAHTEVTYVRRRRAPASAVSATALRERIHEHEPVTRLVSYHPPPRPSRAGSRP
jgi:uncharacterized RDD family membrane protein YckC